MSPAVPTAPIPHPLLRFSPENSSSRTFFPADISSSSPEVSSKTIPTSVDCFYSPVAGSLRRVFNVKNQMIKYLTSAFSTEILINCIISGGRGLFFCHFNSRIMMLLEGYSFAACKSKRVFLSFNKILI